MNILETEVFPNPNRSALKAVTIHREPSHQVVVRFVQ